MRYILLILLVMLGTPLSIASNMNDADSIVVYYSDWSMLTEVLSCGEFQSIANSKYIVHDKEVITDLTKEIACLEKYDPRAFNVRCKILFFKDGNIATSVCMDSASVLYKGRLFKNSPKLLSIIDSITLGSPISVPKESEYPKKSSFVIGGEEKVKSKTLRLLNKEDIPKNGFRLVFTCHVDVEGNTFKVALPRCPTFINERKKEKIKRIIQERIKWNYNEERSPTEILFYSIKIK